MYVSGRQGRRKWSESKVDGGRTSGSEKWRLTEGRKRGAENKRDCTQAEAEGRQEGVRREEGRKGKKGTRMWKRSARKVPRSQKDGVGMLYRARDSDSVASSASISFLICIQHRYSISNTVTPVRCNLEVSGDWLEAK